MGRPVGSKTKRGNQMRFDLLGTLRAKGYDPVAALLETREEARKQFKKRTSERATGFGGQGYLAIVRECDSDIMQYVYPKLKNMELTGADGADFFQSFTQMIKNVVDGTEKKE